MEQTAVELLIASIAHDERTKWMVDDYEWKAILKQARLEEKEQIIESYKAGVWDLGCKSADSEEYYNRTFKQQEQ